LPVVPSLKSCSPPVTVPPAVRVATPASENSLEFASIPLAENVKFPDRVAVVPDVMLTGADAAIVGVMVEAAVRVTLAAAAGAVYVVVAPLAVCVGLKDPQVPTGVQLQSTPAFAVSLATVAATDAVAFTAREVGGAVLSVTVSAGAVAVIVTAADAVVELFEVAAATMVTLPAADGAVYVVAAPLAVCAGLKVPQAPAGEQLQSTPAFAESFVTVAAMETVPLTAKVAGGAVLKVIARAGGGGVTV
jgi:hypothetical protein